MKTRRFAAGEIQAAAALLREGGLLGIPTETVYGLGANGLDEVAVSRIFAAKGRPQDNPLILHVPEAGWLERYCQKIPPAACALAERFWPGPLTMILKRRDMVPDGVTAGLDTVGMRCPAHPLCRAIIAAAGVPVAAPSGNTSGRPSPTSAQDMLEDMDGKIDGIVDGGPCAVGVESTIVDLTETPPRLLRPGGVTLEELRGALGEVAVDPAVIRLMGAGERPRAPGMKYRHYAPRAPVTVVKGDPIRGAAYILRHMRPQSGVICFDEYAPLFAGRPVERLGPAGDVAEQARRVFDALRSFDGTDVTVIWAQCPDDNGLGLAVANRLKKAAGFHVVDLNGARAGTAAGLGGPIWRVVDPDADARRAAFLEEAARRITPRPRSLREGLAWLEQERGAVPCLPAGRENFAADVLEGLAARGLKPGDPIPELDIRCWRVTGPEGEGWIWAELVSGQCVGKGPACRAYMDELELFEGVTAEDIETRSPRFRSYANILREKNLL